MLQTFNRIALAATLLAFIVVILGAYVRLNHAGLSCPDWPGCYGQLFVSENAPHIDRFAAHPLVPHKAWKEMIHRYLASALGLMILILAGLAIKAKKELKHLRALSFTLVAFVIFQGLLGMWTVTLKLHPLIVLAHLFGGFTTLSLLWLAYLKSKATTLTQTQNIKSSFIIAALILLVVQIGLGGWTSANYAALACVDFPTCLGSYWPAMNFAAGFDLFQKLGVNYEFGLFDHPARVAIHYTHRMGAVLTALFLIALAFKTILHFKARRLGLMLLVALAIQICLGISNVVFALPLAVGVAHNGVAAVLLLLTITITQIQKS